MKETSKAFDLRQSRGDFENYLKGDGIDIGCGDDCLTVLRGSVLGWDVLDGDASLLASINSNKFDFVYSSHCLEDLQDIEVAIKNWVRVLKPGGFLYLAVPDFVLYEKQKWPPIFNRNHKYSFSIDIALERPSHFNIKDRLIPLLEKYGVKTLYVCLEDAGYNHAEPQRDQTMTGALAQICVIGQK